MARGISRWGASALATVMMGLVGMPAQAAFMGLEPGDVIADIDFTIPIGGVVFTDSTNALDVDAVATSILTTTPEVLFEIAGGEIDIRLDVASESLTHVFGTFYNYVATFSGRASVSDVSIFAPTGGPAPEQDGRLLIDGEIVGSPTLTVFFDSTFANLPSFTMVGTFSVTGGDSLFQSTFGGVGDLADIFATSSSSVPNLGVLLADGWLFSVRDTVLGDCVSFGACSGTVLNQSGSWTGAGGGQISPQNASAFVPEPSSFLLMGGGLVGVLGYARRRTDGGRA